MKKQAFLLLAPLLLACGSKKEADLLVFGAKIYTTSATALAIEDGKIVAAGTAEELRNTYHFAEEKDYSGKFISPGWIDAHAHFHGYATTLLQVDLVGSRSWQEVLDRSLAFSQQNTFSWITGRGWNQEEWELKQFPDNKELNKLFPDIPVFLKRIDGHAGIANAKALELAGVTPKTKVQGGKIELKNGECTGLLIDEAMSLVGKVIPEYPDDLMEIAYLRAQDSCFRYGLTALADAGLNPPVLEKLRKLYDDNILLIGMYAMISADEAGIAYARKNGPIRKGNFHVQGFKVYADGALGSRGALLKTPYCDEPGHFGILITPVSRLDSILQVAKELDFQVNTHCIGDSAQHLVLTAYSRFLEKVTNPLDGKRWRIEHAQVTDSSDLPFYRQYGVIPSVQPVHLASDYVMADKRLCNHNQRGYQYKSLLQAAGLVALGTDFPVEKIDPRLSILAATARRDAAYQPSQGYFPQQALSLEETLKGMTTWAAFSQFEEKERGELAPGFRADFVVLNQPLEELIKAPGGLNRVEVLETWVGGKQVYRKQ